MKFIISFYGSLGYLCSELHINRVATCQGKVGEKQNFLWVRELSGNFEKMSGNFCHLTHVREFCLDSRIFSKTDYILLLTYIFQDLEILIGLTLLGIHSYHTFFAKYLITL